MCWKPGECFYWISCRGGSTSQVHRKGGERTAHLRAKSLALPEVAEASTFKMQGEVSGIPEGRVSGIPEGVIAFPEG